MVVNGLPATIVGIAPRGFAGLSFDSGANLWATAPLAASMLPADTLTGRRMRRFFVCVRLKEGVSPAQLTGQLSTVAERLRGEDPAAWIDGRGATRRVTLVRELQARFITAPGAAQAIATSVLGAIERDRGAGVREPGHDGHGSRRGALARAERQAGARRLSGSLLRQLATESLLMAIAGTIVGVGAVAAALTMLDRVQAS